MRKLAKISGLFVAAIFALTILAGSANAGWSILEFADQLAISGHEEAAAPEMEKEEVEAVTYKEGEELPQIDEFKLLETQRYDG